MLVDVANAARSTNQLTLMTYRRSSWANDGQTWFTRSPLQTQWEQCMTLQAKKTNQLDPLGWPWVGNALKWGNTSMSVLWHRHSHSVPSQSPAGPSVHWLATALQTGQTRPFTQTSLDSNHLLPRGGNRSSELNPLVSLPTMSPFAHWLWRVNVPLDCSSLMNELLQDHVFHGVIKGRE